MKQDATFHIRSWFWGRRPYGWFFLLGAVLHFGTAALRVDAILPAPQTVDLASYYAGAWSFREGITPYAWSPELLDRLEVEQQLPSTLVDRDGVVPGHNSPPLWAWLMQPITYMSFPAASWVWLFLSLGVIAWCTVRLAGVAGLEHRRAPLYLFPLVLTFSPIFLSLILGQNSLFLLVAALLIGAALATTSERGSPWIVLAWVIAVGAKLFPVAWIGSLIFLGRWRLLIGVSSMTAVAFGAVWIATPEINADYWFRFLPARTDSYFVNAPFGDQSLLAWLDRIARPHTFDVHLLASSKEVLTWTPPWTVSQEAVMNTNLLLLGLLGLGIVHIWWKAEVLDGEGFFYLIVLFALLGFPHMARYNHVLVLPAMAWLWRASPPRRYWIPVAYLLLGLSRVINLLVAILPTPLGLLVSGTGVVTICLLGLSIARTLTGADPIRGTPRAEPVPGPGDSVSFIAAGEAASEGGGGSGSPGAPS